MELLLILILALIVFGPHRLPEMMGQLGRAFRDFQRTTSQLSDEFNRTLQAELAETKAVIEETKSVVQETKAVMTDAAAGFKSAATPAPQLTTPAPQTLPGEAEHANGRAEPAAPDASNSGWNWETPVQEPASAPSSAPPPESPTEAPTEGTEAVPPGAGGPKQQGGESDAPGPGQGAAAARPTPAGDDALLPPY